MKVVERRGGDTVKRHQGARQDLDAGCKVETGSLRRNRVRARAGSAWQTARRPEHGGEGHTGCAVLELPSCRWYLKTWH